MTNTNTAHKKAIREYQRKHPGTTFPEARRATDHNQAPRVRLGTDAAGKTVWLDLSDSVVTPIVGRTGSGKTTILRLIAAELAATRGDIDVQYVQCKSSPMRMPVPVAPTARPFDYLWEVIHTRTAHEPSRLLVLVIDELDTHELASLATVVQALRGVRMYLVIGTQGAASGVEQWARSTSRAKPWSVILNYCQRWIYSDIAVDDAGRPYRKCYLGVPSWMHAADEPTVFTPHDEAAHIAARAVLAGSSIAASFAAVGIGLPAAGKAPENIVAPYEASVGDVAVLTGGYGVVLGSGQVYVDGRLWAPQELAARPDFLGFSAASVRSAAPGVVDGLGE
ncbi:ATP-binding cassette domain-containing protein [Mycobacteroides abscessus]|nr:ATP-binding cassette domain-containing protein [Mycobacteroides abscessus]MDM2412349.1 ATP-binding cassette domain-containing protein [Mycobacteroides abscessus]